MTKGSDDHFPVEISWNLFKSSGKWAYGGVAKLSGRIKLWGCENDLLAELEKIQTEVIDGTITKRVYTLVIMETKHQTDNPSYNGFYTHLFPAKEA